MAKTRILIVDQDARAIQVLREHLIKSDFEVSAQEIFKGGQVLREPTAPHLILLSERALGMGLPAIQSVRQESQVPIIALLTDDDVSRRIELFDVGADDCVMAAIDPRELIARIQSILRRTSSRDAVTTDFEVREWRFNGLVVQSNRRRVTLDNETVELTTAEFDLLRLFLHNTQQPLSREMILDQLRGVEWESVDRSVDILISRLRTKLRDNPRKPRFIKTVRSIGYQFVGEIEKTAEVVEIGSGPSHRTNVNSSVNLGTK